jgi:phosphoribosylglycinamide formyltransferase-1
MKNLAVLASGRGSNFRVIIDHINLGVLQNVNLSLLLCNDATAPAISIARQNQVEFNVIEGIQNKNFTSPREREIARNRFDENALAILRSHNVDFVALAGFMQVLGGTFVQGYESRILNIHPSIDLVRFGGKGMYGENVHAAVINAGEKESGCTVHYVDQSVDGGPIIVQSKIPVNATDDAHTLAQRVLVQEHRTYSKAIQLHADDRAHVSNGEVLLDLSGGWEDEWNRRQKQFNSHREQSSELVHLT